MEPEIRKPSELAPLWPDVVRLLRAVHDHHQPLLGFELLDDWAERQRDFFDPAQPGVLLLVASVRNRLVGLLNGRIARNTSIFRETVLLIDNMYVEPAERGAGIGRRLLDSAIEWGQSQGATEARLTVVHGNTLAERFYEGAGFEPRARLLARKL